MKIPITLKQMPRLTRDLWERRQVLQRSLPRQAHFRLCYFSCHSYFKYLVCALHSLKHALTDIRHDVIVFNDIDMPMSSEQTAALQNLMPNLRVVDWPKSMGWGVEQIGRIWQAYGVAAEGLQDDDFVVRVDADVFFFNDRIFQAVQRSDAGLIGDGHFVDFAYCQGGCYFLRRSTAVEINRRLEQTPLADLAPNFGTVVEDVAATYLVKWVERRVWMTLYMMFPDELRNAGGLSRAARAKFSCIHFVMKNKDAMLEAYEREMLEGSELQAFRAMASSA